MGVIRRRFSDNSTFGKYQYAPGVNREMHVFHIDRRPLHAADPKIGRQTCNADRQLLDLAMNMRPDTSPRNDVPAVGPLAGSSSISRWTNIDQGRSPFLKRPSMGKIADRRFHVAVPDLALHLVESTEEICRITAGGAIMQIVTGS